MVNNSIPTTVRLGQDAILVRGGGGSGNGCVCSVLSHIVFLAFSIMALFAFFTIIFFGCVGFDVGEGVGMGCVA